MNTCSSGPANGVRKGMVFVADSAGRWFGLPTASQGLEVSLKSISSRAQGADPRQELRWIVWSYKRGCFQSRICLCCQVSAQSSARPLSKSFVLCKVLSQGKERLCAPGLSSMLPSQHHVVLKAVFRPSCKEQDKSNIEVFWPCTAALKLCPEEETALPAAEDPVTEVWGRRAGCRCVQKQK